MPHYPFPGVFLYRLGNCCSVDYQRAWKSARSLTGGREKVARECLDRMLWQYLRYCKEFSKFWRERWPSAWKDFSPDEAPAVLEALPCITKEELRQYGEDLRIMPEQRCRNDGFSRIKKQFVNSSGGSTGVPTIVWQDRRWGAANRAMVDFAYRTTGVEPGSPTFFLWGSDRELSELRKSVRKRVSTRLRGLTVMPAFSMSEDRMLEFVDLVNRRQDIENAICFVTALDTLTDYIVRRGISVRKLRRVITGGGTLYPELRRRVLGTVAVEVYDMYGSRDAGIMAIETPAHNGLAVLQWHNYLEILDKDMQRCKPGETGRVFVTALENYSTALIRMDMGDMATVGSGRDVDWRWTVLRQLNGRTAEHLVTPEGSRIEPAAIIHLIGVVIRPEWLKKFQVVQRRPDDFVVKVEVWSHVSEEDARSFTSRVREAMAKLCRCDVSVVLQIVDQIVTGPSGKHSYCISMPTPSKSADQDLVSG